MKYVTLLLLVFLTFSCDDQEYSAVPSGMLPSTPFYLDDSEFINFLPSTSIALDTESGGYAGLILYYVNNDLIYAYDRCCPLHVDEKEQLECNGILAMCPTDSVYYPLLDGEPAIEMGGQSILRSYKTILRGTSLTVYN